MADASKAFLDFYGEHNISPVSQDISDVRTHYARRGALYRQLGVPPRLIKGAHVLEFGPGSGHNALFTKSLNPEKYVLVDANPTGLKHVRTLLDADNSDTLSVVDSLIEEFDTDERFDLVLCEGVIPWQKDPAALLKHITRFAAPGGIVIMTCIDAVSSVSENLRRLMALMESDPASTIKDRLQELLPLFAPHLNTLQGMTRPHKDWILDQILQPFIGKLFSMREAIETLDDEFSVHGTSPRFLVDWTWYKEVPDRAESDNRMCIRQFEENIHNFIDYQELHPPRLATDNRLMADLCDRLFANILTLEKGMDQRVLETTAEQCGQLAVQASTFSKKTGTALGEFHTGLLHAMKTGHFPDMPAFAGLFGRGQQYLSFIHNSA